MERISYHYFERLDLQIVKVVKAERVPNKDRILKLTIQTGSNETKTVIIGGAEFYSPEHFLGKKFVALVNISPKVIAGIESDGMLLAAISDKKPFWLSVDEEVPVGAKII